MHTVLCVILKYVRVSLYGNSHTQNEERTENSCRLERRETFQWVIWGVQPIQLLQKFRADAIKKRIFSAQRFREGGFIKQESVLKAGAGHIQTDSQETHFEKRRRPGLCPA